MLCVRCEHLLGELRLLLLCELSRRANVRLRRVELHSGDPDAFRDADADAVDDADGEPYCKPDTELDTVVDVYREPDLLDQSCSFVDVDREYHGDAVNNIVAEHDSACNGHPHSFADNFADWDY